MDDIFLAEEPTTINELDKTMQPTTEACRVLREVARLMADATNRGLEPRLVCFDVDAWRDLTGNRYSQVGPLQHARVYDLPVRLFDALPGCPTGVKLLVK